MGLHDLLLADLLPAFHASADRLPQVGKMQEFFFLTVEEFVFEMRECIVHWYSIQ